ncbi:MAG: Na+:solute symporter, partial [Woeseiaceae bacterium]
AVSGKTSILPDLSDPNQYVPLLLVPLLVQWWSVWYPGSEPGGGGYVAQRMLAAKNERHAVGASALFNFCHYAVRPWPWILVALASIVIYPDLDSLRNALPQVPAHLLQDDLAYSAMLAFLPHGVLGMVVASLAAAYVSTISTSLNWGASYLINDFYRCFVNKDASERETVLVARVVTVLLMVLAGTVALMLESALQAFRLMLSIGAGTGLLFLLRWFWHRINVWSEISAMVLSFAVSMFFEFGPFSALAGWEKMVYGVAVTTAGWIIVTLVTPTTSVETLHRFDLTIRSTNREVRHGIYAVLFGTAGIYSTLFMVGSLLYGQNVRAAILAGVASASIYATARCYGMGPSKT